MLFKTLGKGDKIRRVHGKPIGMAGVAHNLITIALKFAVHGAGPIALHRVADYDHRAAIVCRPILQGLERRHHLIVIIAIL